MFRSRRAPVQAPDTGNAIDRLEADGLVEWRQGHRRTTRKLQSAMARAAARLLSSTGDGEDVRVPIACALFELYGEQLSDAQLAQLVEALLPIELAELDPRSFLSK